MIDVCDIHVMKPLLEQCGFHFSKARGQNFLTAPWVVERIASAAAPDANTGVLEIGAGMGALTQQLCLRAGRVCAVEVDRRLEPVLARTVGAFSNLNIVWNDILRLDIPALVRAQFPAMRAIVCANLPYSITTPALTALLEARCFEGITVMVQKEVADRIAARAGTPQYGALSVFCAYHAAAERLFDVPNTCFVPQPKVTSTVVRLTPYVQNPWGVCDEAVFFRAVRGSFSMRRKKLSNSLAAAFPALGKAGAEAAIAACGLAETVRGETLDVAAFASLANEIARRTA